MNNELTVIIPCYNEEKSLKSFLPKILDYCSAKNYRLFIINDGSSDNTEKILNEFKDHENFKIFNHKLNKGYGASVKTGIKNSETKYCLTLDADGQHAVSDIENLYNSIKKFDGDMVIGSRKGKVSNSKFRDIGKWLIRNFAKIFMKLHIYDINTGMRIFRTDLSKNYLHLLPDSFPFCDIITLLFVYNKHSVYEEKIKVKDRIAGKSTIGIHTAFETFMEILNISVLFNPMKLFLPISIFFILIGVLWGGYILSLGRGVSVGASLAITTGIITFLIGLIAEQLTAIRRHLKD